MSTKKDTTSKSKLERREITLQLDAEAKKLAGKGLNAETYLQVMRNRDQAALSVSRAISREMRSDANIDSAATARARATANCSSS